MIAAATRYGNFLAHQSRETWQKLGMCKPVKPQGKSVWALTEASETKYVCIGWKLKAIERERAASPMRYRDKQMKLTLEMVSIFRFAFVAAA